MNWEAPEHDGIIGYIFAGDIDKRKNKGPVEDIVVAIEPSKYHRNESAEEKAHCHFCVLPVLVLLFEPRAGKVSDEHFEQEVHAERANEKEGCYESPHLRNLLHCENCFEVEQ